MSEVEELDNPSSKNKCVDQIRGVCEAHLRLYLNICKKILRFSKDVAQVWIWRCTINSNFQSVILKAAIGRSVSANKVKT